MKSTISRWGNSLALRLPKEAIELANLHDGDEVTIIEDRGRLILDPQTRVNLDALIAQMSPETLHDDPFAAAPVVGAEIW
jgi:antitoxin MazE